jgi:hypothetical protein
MGFPLRMFTISGDVESRIRRLLSGAIVVVLCGGIDVVVQFGGIDGVVLSAGIDGVAQAMLDEGAKARASVRDAAAKGQIAPGNMSVPGSRHQTVRLLNGDGCAIVAAGPIGATGLAIARAFSETGIYQLDLPQSGKWNLVAECDGGTLPIEPAVVVVPADRDAPPCDARVLDRPADP